jgi:hypothetical protein
MDKNELLKFLAVFLNDKVTIPFGRKILGKDWIEERKETYEIYRRKFSRMQIKYITENEFHYFLTFKGNKSWTNLPRRCKGVTQEMRKLKHVLGYLQDESILVEDRLNTVLRGGKFHITGFGKNLATGLLHVFDWRKYGVWNNRSQKVLTQMRRLPYISYSNLGQSYGRFNSELQKLARELETDLAHLDGFLWWLDENKKI